VSILYWTLGTALGILLHIVLFPSSVEHIFKAATKGGQLPADPRRDDIAELLSSSGKRSADSEPTMVGAQ
jgi:hypothetical protein